MMLFFYHQDLLNDHLCFAASTAILYTFYLRYYT